MPCAHIPIDACNIKGLAIVQAGRPLLPITVAVLVGLPPFPAMPLHFVLGHQGVIPRAAVVVVSGVEGVLGRGQYIVRPAQSERSSQYELLGNVKP